MANFGSSESEEAQDLRLRPAFQFRGTAALAVLVLLPASSGFEPVARGITLLIVIPLLIRVVFFLGVSADNSGITVRRLLGTRHIARSDVTTVQFREPRKTSLKNKTIGDTARLTIFGRDLEPFRLAIYESAPDKAQRFAVAANTVLNTARPPVGDETLEIVLEHDGRRQWQSSNVLRLIPALMLPISLGTIAGFSGIRGDTPPDSFFATPVAIVVSFLVALGGLLLLKPVVQRYIECRKWAPYFEAMMDQLPDDLDSPAAA